MVHVLDSPRQWSALGLGVVTSTAVFLRRLTLLNKFVWPPTRTHLFAYAVTLMAGFLFWATLNTIERTLGQQLLYSLTTTVLGWAPLVVIVNGQLQYPTRQQLLSLLFFVVTETTVAVQLRLVLGRP